MKAVAVECARLAVQAKYTAPALTRLTTPTTASVVGAEARRRDAPSIFFGNGGGAIKTGAAALRNNNLKKMSFPFERSVWRPPSSRK